MQPARHYPDQTIAINCQKEKSSGQMHFDSQLSYLSDHSLTFAPDFFGNWSRFLHWTKSPKARPGKKFTDRTLIWRNIIIHSYILFRYIHYIAKVMGDPTYNTIPYNLLNIMGDPTYNTIPPTYNTIPPTYNTIAYLQYHSL